MKKYIVRLLALMMAVIFVLPGCGKETPSENQEKTPADNEAATWDPDNKWINCEPAYSKSDVEPLSPDGERVWAYSWGEYLEAKEASGFTPLANWLPWEQFSALGTFYRSFWWEGQPTTSQYEYLYTDPSTGESFVYHVSYKKIPKDSGVTNIKEYNQWYYGKEILNYPTVMNQLTLAAKDFSNADLLDVDPNDSVFAECKNKYGDFGYYVDDILDLTYYTYSDVVGCLQFVYNGWKIRIIKDTVVEKREMPSLKNQNPDIINRLINGNTYKQAIEELMDPKNAVPAD